MSETDAIRHIEACGCVYPTDPQTGKRADVVFPQKLADVVISFCAEHQGINNAIHRPGQDVTVAAERNAFEEIAARFENPDA